MQIKFITLWAACLLATAQLAHGQSNKGQYHHLKGTIGGLPVTMDVVEEKADIYSGGWAFAGHYYYDKYQQSIHCYGNLDSVGKVLLYEMNEQNKEIYFYGSFDDKGGFSGTWNDKTSGKTLPVALRPADNMAVRLDFFQMSDSIQLWPDKPNSPKADFTVQMLLPAKGTDKQLAAFLNDQIFSGTDTDSLPRSYARTAPEAFYKKQRDQYFEIYVNTYKDEKPEDVAEMPYAYYYDSSSKMSVFFNENNLLSLGYTTYEYSGGAHGNYGTALASYDIKARKTVQINDVFLPKYEKTLDKALENALRKQFGLAKNAPLTEVLFEEKIVHNENFCLVEKGILFLYVPYEIAAYAMGEIALFVPFKDIKTVVKPQYLK